MDMQPTNLKAGVARGRGNRDDLRCTRTTPLPAGGEAPWTQETAATAGCQVALDAKAFTGRGNLRELRQLTTAIGAVEQRMEALSSASKTLVNAGMYLVMHRHRRSGYTFLRWRERSGANRHLPWDEAAARLANQPAAQQRWCSEASSLASHLNTEHLGLRERITALRLQLRATPAPVYARPIPETG